MRAAAALGLALLAGLARADVFVREDILTEPRPDAFSVCYDHSCTSVAQLSLAPERWEEVRGLFLVPAADATAEREQIGAAVALLERIVGPLTGTEGDLGRNATRKGVNPMDCIDESTNTTTYLRMMRADGLLRFHEPVDRATRGYFFAGFPHTTAVIRELKGGDLWAVDSWFHDNGVAPEIVRLPQWKDGWEPGP